MLSQRNGEVIHIFPAMPRHWYDALHVAKKQWLSRNKTER